MTELYGNLQRLTLVASIALIPLGPLLAAVLIFAARMTTPQVRSTASDEGLALPTPRAPLAPIAAAAGAAFALLAIAAHVAMLAARPPSERYFTSHLLRLVRLGQLDLNLDLAFDPLAAVLATAVTAGALVASLAHLRAPTPAPRADAVAGWMSLAVGSVLVLVMAEGFVPMLLGAEVAAVAVFGMAGPAASLRGLVAQRAAGTAFLVACALLFWGLGGTFTPDEYIPELEARFAAVTLGEAPSPAADDSVPRATVTTGKGYVTLSSYPGAELFVDDPRYPLADADGRVVLAPLVHVPLAGGIHSFRVHPGSGLDDFVVNHVAFGGGREIALALFGPTLSFRLLRDELAVHDDRGIHAARDRLLDKRIGGIEVVDVVALLAALFAFGSAFATLSSLAERPTPAGSALVVVVASVTAASVLGRLGFLLGEAHGAQLALAVVGAVAALASALSATVAPDVRSVLARVTFAQLALLMVASAVSAFTALTFHVVAFVLAMGSLVLSSASAITARSSSDDGFLFDRIARDRPLSHRAGRAFFVGALALSGAPIPLLGAAWSRDDILARLALSEATRPVPAALFVAVALGAVFATSFALFRAYFVMFSQSRRGTTGDGTTTRPSRDPVVVLALVAAAAAAAVGLLAGVGARLAGSEGASLFDDILAPAFATVRVAADRDATGLRIVLAVASFATSFAAFRVARARFGGRPAPSAVAPPPSPLARLSELGERVVSGVLAVSVALARRVADVAVDLDRWVIDGAIFGAVNAARAAAWVNARADESIVDGGVLALAVGAAGVGDRLRQAQGRRLRRYVVRFVLTIAALMLLYYTFLKR